MAKEKDTEKEKKGAAGKIQTLHKQYNKIICGLFEEHASCCVNEALEGASGPLGEDIQGIVRSACDSLCNMVLEELGVSTGESEESLGVGLDDELGVELGPGVALGVEVDTEDNSDDTEIDIDTDTDDSTEDKDDEDDDEETDKDD